MHALAYLVGLGLGVGIPLLMYNWLRAPLEGIVKALVDMSDATEFYLRSFVLVMVFAGLGRVLGPLTIAGQDPKNPAPPRFMQYVWAVAERAQTVLWDISIYVLFFVAVVTILSAALRSREWTTKHS